MYKLDRTVFKAQTAQEAADTSSYSKKLTMKERLKIAFYLNSIAFNFDINNPPKMDKTVYSERKHS